MLLRWIICAALVAATAATASAQPAKPDLAEAARLYHSAEQAMTERRYDDAARDYGAAYEISKDAVLFFKIGSALDKGGKCPVAVNYYRRYLREGKPSQEHQKLTSERIAACEGQPKAAPRPETKPDDKAPAKPDDKAKAASEGGDGSAGAAPGAAPAADTATAEPQLAADGPLAAAAAALAAEDGGAGDGSVAEPVPEVAALPADPDAGPGAGSDASPAAEEPGSLPPPSARGTAAWLSVGTGIAFVTIGAVLALSAESTEDDIADLYIIRAGGDPLTYDGRTKQRYDELVDRGDRYQTLAWVSFGLAGAAAAAAAYLFLTSPASATAERAPEKRLALRPLVTRHGGGVAASWQFD